MAKKTKLQAFHDLVENIETAMFTTKRKDGLLIGVNIRLAVYLEVNKPQPLVLFEVVRGMVTGKSPKFPPTKTITKKRR